MHKISDDLVGTTSLYTHTGAWVEDYAAAIEAFVGAPAMVLCVPSGGPASSAVAAALEVPPGLRGPGGVAAALARLVPRAMRLLDLRLAKL